MKSLSENSSNFPSWLGFSLSNHMNMESNNNNDNLSSLNSSHNNNNNNDNLSSLNSSHNNNNNNDNLSSLNSSHNNNNNNINYHDYHNHENQNLNNAPECFDIFAENGNNNKNNINININHNHNINVNNNGSLFMHAPLLSVMPLKSDGSLCIMEALSQSQHSQAHSSPKLENFFGNGQERRETVPPSFDTIYYQQKQHQFDSYFSTQGFSQENFFKNCLNYNIINHNNNYNIGLVHNNNNNNNNNMNIGCSSSSMGVIPTMSSSSLALSMSPVSQSSCVTANNCSLLVGNAIESSKKRGLVKISHKQSVCKKASNNFGQRTSQFRGVTKHRWTGRYEAHLWDNSCKKEGQTRKGRQVYLGGYDLEEKAARSYDLAALKYWGTEIHTNFPIENYKDEIDKMQNMSRQEFVAHLRRKSTGFSRGASIYRGVTRHHHQGRWQARIGRVAGNKDLYLGTFNTQEEAAEAYDVAAIKFRGTSAVTNFDITRYHVEKIMASNTLIAGDQAKRHKTEPIKAIEDTISVENPGDGVDWKMMLYHNSLGMQQHNSASINHGDYANNPTFSLALQDLVGHGEAKLGSAHFSNDSSLVTSLNSSREGSPGGNDPSRFVSPVSVVSPWMGAWGDT